jgi:hypothetical protein
MQTDGILGIDAFLGHSWLEPWFESYTLPEKGFVGVQKFGMSHFDGINGSPVGSGRPEKDSNGRHHVGDTI